MCWPCGLVCFAALVALRAWRLCLTLRVMCAHKRAAQHAALACACLIWRCISSGLRLVRCGWSVVGVPVRLSSQCAPAAPHAPGCPSGRLWRQAVRVQWVGCSVFLSGTLSWRCRVLATPVPLPQHRMPSAVLLGGGRGKRFGGAGGRWLFVVRWCRVALAMCWPCWVAWCALLHLSCCVRGGLARHCVGCVPTPRAQEACHTRAAQHAAFACACLIWRCAFFLDLALLCFSKRLGPRCAGGAWGPHILAVVRSDVVQLHFHTSGAQRRFDSPSARLLRCSPTAPPRQWGCGGSLAG